MVKVKYLLVILSVFFLASCEKTSPLVAPVDPVIPVDGETDDLLDYSDFPDHQITSFDEAEHMNNNRYIVYYYSDYCSHCKTVKQDILTLFSEYDALDFYLVNTATAEGSSSVPEYIGTPSLFVFSEGEAVDFYIGYIEIGEFITLNTDFQVDYDDFLYRTFIRYDGISHMTDTEYIIYVYDSENAECALIKDTVLPWIYQKSETDIYFINRNNIEGDIPASLDVLNQDEPLFILMSGTSYTGVSYQGSTEILDYITLIGDGDISVD